MQFARGGIEKRPHLRLVSMRAHIAVHSLARVWKEDVAHESDRAYRAFDIDERYGGAKMHRYASSFGKFAAMLSPVKSATQPSGLMKSRIAVNSGFGPMSNQCFVPPGTLMRSPLQQTV